MRAHRGAGAIVVWLVCAALWVLLTAALVSFDPLDPPSHAVAPPRAAVSNIVGAAGAWTAYFAFVVLGPGVWALALAAGAALLATARGVVVAHPAVRVIGLAMLAAALSGVVALFAPRASAFPEGAGGLVGIALAEALRSRFGMFGATVWLGLTAAIGAIVALDEVVRRGGSAALSALLRLARRAPAAWGARPRLGSLRPGGRRGIRLNDVDDDVRPRQVLREEARALRAAAERDAQQAERADAPAAEAAGPDAPQAFDPDRLRARIARLPVHFAGAKPHAATEQDIAEWRLGGELEGYQFPGLELLEDPEANYSKRMERHVREQARALEQALRTYRIKGQVVGADSGPVITLYEVRLAPGTKVSQVSAVAQDLARALKAVNVRIVPNTAGRDTVGVEAPNLSRERVRLKELMASPKGKVASEEMSLPMFLGKDVGGGPLIEDLAAMPHLLIAGATGSGKSVCMNSVIMSFLYTRKPNELKLVLIDPKMVEMSQFRDIPHLMCPVVTEMSKAAAILEWAVAKMDERYSLLAEAGVRDIASYNRLSWQELQERFEPTSPEEAARIPRRLPFIVFVIDELADLIMTHKEVEGFIVRVAQKARAVGMHLVIATQRPQANVVTGLIKSNMPGRICFKVSSGMDSRIVLDQKGGELLLGQGDMLFLSSRSHKLVRAQGALVEDHEARKVVRFLRDVAAPSFERQLMQIRPGSGETRDGLAAAQEDPLFDKAVEIVLETKRGSVSLLQRRLAIGYTRASRLIDMMGEAGIIGGYKGTVAREVMISRAEWDAMKAQAQADARAGLAADAPEGAAARVAALQDSGRLGNLPPAGPASGDEGVARARGDSESDSREARAMIASDELARTRESASEIEEQPSIALDDDERPIVSYSKDDEDDDIDYGDEDDEEYDEDEEDDWDEDDDEEEDWEEDEEADEDPEDDEEDDADEEEVGDDEEWEEDDEEEDEEWEEDDEGGEDGDDYEDWEEEDEDV